MRKPGILFASLAAVSMFIAGCTTTIDGYLLNGDKPGPAWSDYTIKQVGGTFEAKLKVQFVDGKYKVLFPDGTIITFDTPEDIVRYIREHGVALSGGVMSQADVDAIADYIKDNL